MSDDNGSAGAEVTQEMIDQAAADGADAGQIAGAAALLQKPNEPAAPRQLDPNRPMFHLVPPSIMQDVLEILKGLPFEKVHRVMPALLNAPLHQDEPPTG